MRDMRSAARRGGLWASVAEGRPPQDGEVESFAAKIWHDTYRRGSTLDWQQVEIGSPIHRKTIAAALFALGGPAARLLRD